MESTSQVEVKDVSSPPTTVAVELENNEVVENGAAKPEDQSEESEESEEEEEPTSREDQLLDTFPLNKNELGKLLDFHQHILNDSNADSRYENAESEEYAKLLGAAEESMLPLNFVKAIINRAIETSVVFGGVSEEDENERKYLEAVSTCLGRRGQRSVLDLMFAYASAGDSNVDVQVILKLVKQLVLVAHVLRGSINIEEVTNFDPPKIWLSSFSTKKLTRAKWVDWATWKLPLVFSSLAGAMHYLLLSPSHPVRATPPPLHLPSLEGESALWSKPYGQFPMTLACFSSSLGGVWRRLYSSEWNGASFPIFANALLGYSGPTCTLIRTTTNDVIGFFTSCPWKKSVKWYGEGADSFLFRLYPTIAMYPPTGKGKHHQYFNTPMSRVRGALRGIAIGGISHDRPRMHITESFEECRVSSVDMTYESGPLLQDDLQASFDVDVIELFAVDATLDDYEGHRKSGALQIAIHEATRMNAAKVDRSQFVDDFVSGVFLNRAFEHREHTTGRHDFTTIDRQYFG